ncbi:hypothetical protein N7491_002066 [Penicillium cf. griseofulvum]|uniref:Zn(2)-C6 fungal-type domain-containing protein n=1 Tax=Penicillium cf. griseofulvum TaxID=2972120 RepID=A0A9W9MTQ3_9EURO|nr:hypothetical protein N7472_003749 [Penicillium cf. griseofulvum]KAJ5445984.1 hypothetical protein N7491_002066 [Penicillium cf. griseofulvum]
MSSKAQLRTSCDACQSLKIKCSQSKPECDRCGKHGVPCVYSPLRRMGRPKKRATLSQGAQFQSGHLDAQPPQVEDPVSLAAEEEDVISRWPDSNTPISFSSAGSMNDTPLTCSTADQLVSSAGIPVIASERGSWSDVFHNTFMEDIQSSRDCQISFLSRQLPTAARSERKPNGLKRKKSQNIALAAETATPYAFEGVSHFSSQSETATGRHLSLPNGLVELSEPPNRHSTASFVSSSVSHPAISSSDLFTERSVQANFSSPQSSPMQAFQNGSQPEDQSRDASLSDSCNRISWLATPSNPNDSLGTSTTRSASESDGPCRGECHLAILRRLAWLEHSRGKKEKPLTIDVLLAAERDTRLLKEQLFKCSNDMCEDGGCLSSRPSSLMALSLLAECVVSLLEDIFYRAVISARERERIFQTAWPIGSNPTSPGGPRDLSAQQSAARFERSIRGAFDRNITCPVPEANCDLFLGKFGVRNEAKSRAMRQILRRRIRKLLATLVDMKRVVGPRGGVMQRSALQIAEDLHHRVESLQGRVEIAA